MKYGICNLSIVPCRKEPSDKSELVSQLLFGESFKIVEEQNNWLQIENKYDHYSSWIDKIQCLFIEEEEYDTFEIGNLSIITDLVGIITEDDKANPMPVVLGSLLKHPNENEIFSFADKKYSSKCQSKPFEKKINKQAMLDILPMYMNAPYLWGGRSPFGIDCSGFVQQAFRFAGLQIPRDASQQADIGTTLNFVDEALPGDLAFFDNKEGKIIHVGIVLQSKEIIHAHGKVRIDKLDHEGIFNTERNTYSHHLRVVKQINQNEIYFKEKN